MILRYKKVTDKYTTHTLIDPVYDALPEDPKLITELCTIGDTTYVHVPDGVDPPEQPEIIAQSLEVVELTDDLKEEIKAASPHVRLNYKRLQDRIRSKYSLEDEQYFTRIAVGALTGTYMMQEDEPELIADYQAWVEECREVARKEREKLGLSNGKKTPAVKQDWNVKILAAEIADLKKGK